MSSFPSGHMSELASQFQFGGSFYHTTKVEVLLFPELQKVHSPRVELAQEAKMCRCYQVFIKYFATKSMEFNKQGIKPDPWPQESESVVAHRRPAHLGMTGLL